MATKDPLIPYLYNTKTEAENVAKQLGCSGSRQYVVDGQTKYVPCNTSEDFISAIRWFKVQNITVGRGDETFGDDLVGFQFATDSEKGDPFFTLGNFSITTFVPEKKDKAFQLGDFLQPVTSQDLQNKGIGNVGETLRKSRKVKINFDQANILSFVLYSSLREKVRVAVQEIFERFPAALKVNPSNINQPNIIGYTYNFVDNISTFEARVTKIDNPFDIEFLQSGTTLSDEQYITPLRNFSKTYEQYVVWYNDTEYPILDVELPQTRNDDNNLYIIVEGDPFGDVVADTKYGNELFFIRPNQNKIDEFFDELSDLASYLLNRDSTPLYRAYFDFPYRNDEGVLVKTYKSLTFPRVDEHNLDFDSNSFLTYLDDLNQFAENFDQYKTDLIARFLISDTLQEFDTDERKFYKVLQTYGHIFDQTKKYIDGLANMTKVSYDKVNNVPDLLLKNFARTIGWESFDIANTDSLIESIFRLPQEGENNFKPFEIDTELWRRLIINSAYLFKSKGTRRSIEFILELIGVPQNVMEIDEFIYRAEKPLDYTFLSQKLSNIGFHPVSNQGYPTIPSDTYFQEAGGNVIQDTRNIGPYDYGQTYLNKYRFFNSTPAFDLDKVVDNKKSWVYTEDPVNRVHEKGIDDTNYNIDDSRLVINVKNLNVFVSSDLAFDAVIYRLFDDNDINIDNSIGGPYPTTIDVSQYSFRSFLREAFERFVNVRNRKVINHYPTLQKLYSDYISQSDDLNKKQITTSKSLSFINLFDTKWINLIRQFTPATSILTAGKKIANSTFKRNKFAYKFGQNKETGWPGNAGSQYQNLSLERTFNVTVAPFFNEGVYRESLDGIVSPVLLDGDIHLRINGRNNRFAYNDSKYYSIADYDKYNIDLNTENLGISGNSNNTDFVEFSGAYESLEVDYYTPRPLPHVCLYSGFTGSTQSMPYSVLFDKSTGFTASDFVSLPDNVAISGNSLVYEPDGSSASMSASSVIVEFVDLLPSTGDFMEIDISIDDHFYKYTPKVGLDADFGNGIFNEWINIDNIGKLRFKYVDSQSSNAISFSYNGNVVNNTNNNYGQLSNIYINSLVIYETNVYTSTNSLYRHYQDKFVYVNQPVGFGYSATTTQPNDFVAKSPDGTQYFVEYDGNYQNFDYITRFTGRTESDPLMHIEPYLNAYARAVDFNNKVSVNLSDQINLFYEFFKGPDSVYVNNGDSLRPRNNDIDGEFYISDSLTFDFDGFYPTTGMTSANGPGPFYVLDVDNYALPTLSNTTNCSVGENTFLNFGELSTGSTNTKFTFVDNDTPSYFLIDEYGLFKVECDLIFDSSSSILQDVYVKTLDQNENVLDRQKFTFAGSQNSDYESFSARTFTYEFVDLFEEGNEIYIVVEPLDYPCDIIDYHYITPSDFGQISVDDNAIEDYAQTIFYLDINDENIITTINNYYGIWVVDPDVTDNQLEDYQSATTTSFTIENNINFEDGYLFIASSKEGSGTHSHEYNIYGSFYGSQAFERPNISAGIYMGNDNSYSTYYRIINFSKIKFTESIARGVDFNAHQNMIGWHLVYDVPNAYVVGDQMFTVNSFSFSSGFTQDDFVKHLDDDYYYVMRSGATQNWIKDLEQQYFKATDKNERSVAKYGQTLFNEINGDVYLEYYYDNDSGGKPVTGEFIGRLTLKDVCGNLATTFILLFLDYDENQ